MLVLKVVKSPNWMAPEVGTEFTVDGFVVHTIGRSSQADIRIKHPKISREHVRLVPKSRGWYVKDLGSKNGTKVNGGLLSVSQRLKVGDRLRVGAYLFEVMVSKKPSENADHPDIVQVIKPVDAAQRSGTAVMSADDSVDRLGEIEQEEPDELDDLAAALEQPQRRSADSHRGIRLDETGELASGEKTDEISALEDTGEMDAARKTGELFLDEQDEQGSTEAIVEDLEYEEAELVADNQTLVPEPEPEPEMVIEEPDMRTVAWSPNDNGVQRQPIEAAPLEAFDKLREPISIIEPDNPRLTIPVRSKVAEPVKMRAVAEAPVEEPVEEFIEEDQVIDETEIVPQDLVDSSLHEADIADDYDEIVPQDLEDSALRSGDLDDASRTPVDMDDSSLRPSDFADSDLQPQDLDDSDLEELQDTTTPQRALDDSELQPRDLEDSDLQPQDLQRTIVDDDDEIVPEQVVEDDEEEQDIFWDAALKFVETSLPTGEALDKQDKEDEEKAKAEAKEIAAAAAAESAEPAPEPPPAKPPKPPKPIEPMPDFNALVRRHEQDVDPSMISAYRQEEEYHDLFEEDDVFKEATGQEFEEALSEPDASPVLSGSELETGMDEDDFDEIRAEAMATDEPDHDIADEEAFAALQPEDTALDEASMDEAFQGSASAIDDIEDDEVTTAASAPSAPPPIPASGGSKKLILIIGLAALGLALTVILVVILMSGALS